MIQGSQAGTSGRISSGGPRSRSGRKKAPARSTVDRAKTLVACGFLAICCLLGGASRYELLGQLPLRLISLCAIGFALWSMSEAERLRARPFALAILAVGALMLLQLIPLPPTLWEALPGRSFYAEQLSQVGLADHWRPISMAPDLTLNSLLALLPPLAGAMLFAPLSNDGRRLLLDVLLGLLGIGAILAIVQLALGEFYLYRITNKGSGVGLFSNRNHQAVFLATGIVLIVGRWRLSKRPTDPMKLGVALVAVGSVFPLLLATGSRAGLICGFVAYVLAGIFLIRGGMKGRWNRQIVAAIALIFMTIMVLIVGFVSAERKLAFSRLFTELSEDLRVANFPAMAKAIWEFFPFGSGFGTFDPIFRRFEADTLLRPSYFNHAHSDIMEIVLEGGVFAIALLVLGLIIFVRRGSMKVSGPDSTASSVFSKIGGLGLFLLLLGSLVDYPLRTPFLAVLATLFLTWFAAPAEEPSVRRDLAG